MWSWSISASGIREDILNELAGQTCPLNDDGSLQSDATVALFDASKMDAITKVTGWPAQSFGDVSISGNETVSAPNITRRK